LVPITLIQAVVVAPFLIGKDEMQAFIAEAPAWIAGNTGLLAFIIAFVALLYFVILYFASGWLSRFGKRLGTTGKT
jgi:choline-glycine betaine transporter